MLQSVYIEWLNGYKNKILKMFKKNKNKNKNKNKIHIYAAYK